MLAALNTNGTTVIKAKKSRDHTENIIKLSWIANQNS